MYLHQNELTIRDALPADALLLCRWWNDGKVMEHAGFPQGLGTSVEKITHQLLEPNDHPPAHHRSRGSAHRRDELAQRRKRPR